MSDLPVRVSASQVTLILQRAAEIDARGDSLTTEELKRIAAEAGIDPAATESAIQEVVSAEEAAPVRAAEEEGTSVPVTAEASKVPAKRSQSISSRRILAGTAVGAALGFVGAAMGGVGALPPILGAPGMGLAAFGGTLLYLLLRAVQSMKQGAQLDFQLQNFAVWFGMAFLGQIVGYYPQGEVFGIALIFWIVTSIVGGLLVKLGPREEEPEGNLPRIGPGE